MRYFRDSQPEEFAVILKPDGSLHSVWHKLAEEAPGASLDKDQAVARAEEFLRREKKLDLQGWSLVGDESKKRPRRIDHTLTWEQAQPLDSRQAPAANSQDHAHARVELKVLGDEVTNYRTYVNIPESWERQQEERGLTRIIISMVIPFLFYAGLGLTALMVFLKNLRSQFAHSIPWRRITFWSIWALAGYLAVFALGNIFPGTLNAYDTGNPLKLTYAGVAIIALLGAPLYVGGIALLFGMAWYFGSRAYGEERLPGWAGMPAAFYRDALWIGVGGAAGLFGLEHLLAAASEHWPTVHRSLGASFGQDFDAMLPFGAILGGTVVRSLLYTGVVAAVASFLAAQVRQTAPRVLLFLLGALALTGGSWGGAADLAQQFLRHVILLGALALGVRYVMRFNILGCFLMVSGTSLLGGAAELLSQPDSFYRANGYAVLLALVLFFAWPLVAWRMGDRNSPASAAGSLL